MTGEETTLDCALLRDLFGTAEVRALVSSRALAATWLEVEAALALACADAGVIPEADAAAIVAACDASAVDLDAMRAAIADTQHPLVPLIRWLTEAAGPAGRSVHWGATTQDIIDTGLVLMCRRAGGCVARDTGRAAAAAAALARRHADTVMAGRTHGQHAVPTTFGAKAAVWADELARARDRLEAALAALPLSFAGAAGTLASLGDDAVAVREYLARRLELPVPSQPWHVARDRVRDVAHALGQVGAAGERICREIVRLQATEVGEAREPAAPGHVGSSTMPQKRNPMTCEYAIGAALLLRGSTGVVLAAADHAGERDMGPWSAEWIAVPQSLILAGGVAANVAHVLSGLEVDGERMAANLELTRGAIAAEAVMMALAPALGHEAAHELVTRAARAAERDGGTLLAALEAEPDAVAAIGRDGLARAADPRAGTGLAASQAEGAGA